MGKKNIENFINIDRDNAFQTKTVQISIYLTPILHDRIKLLQQIYYKSDRNAMIALMIERGRIELEREAVEQHLLDRVDLGGK